MNFEPTMREMQDLYGRTGMVGITMPARIKWYIAKILHKHHAVFDDIMANHTRMTRNRNAGLAAKREVCWGLRTELQLSYGQIGALLEIDHATAIYHKKKVDQMSKKACAA